MRTRLHRSGQPVACRSGSSTITEGRYAMWRTATKPTYDKPRSFRGWLLTQTYRIDGVGQIARRVAEDSCLGQRLSPEAVRHHTLTFHSAAPDVLDAFNQAIEEWQQGKGRVAPSQTDHLLPQPNSRISVRPARSSGHANTWTQRGRSWVRVHGQSIQYGDILRRSIPISRRAGRALQRTPPALANLLWTNRERRTRGRNRQIGDIGNHYRHARATGLKGGNEASSASDRWYERVVEN